MAQFLFDEPDKGPAPPGTGPTSECTALIVQRWPWLNAGCPSQIRRAMVQDAAVYLDLDWPHSLRPLLVLQDALAGLVLAAHKAERCVLVAPSGCQSLSRRVAPGFSPHNGHAHEGSTGGWIMPTIRISELAVLQIVGLDAAVVRPTPIL